MVNQIDRRVNNIFREGKVVETFPEEGTMVVEFADGFRSKKSPQVTQAGATKVWSPHSVGERIVFLSPTGDPGVGMVLAGGFSDENPQNGNEDAMHRVSIEGVSITQTGSSVVISAGGVTVTISGSGLSVNGGEVSHNGKNIGHDHKHLGVTPGLGISDVPQ
jgi:hypothetical protein